MPLCYAIRFISPFTLLHARTDFRRYAVDFDALLMLPLFATAYANHHARPQTPLLLPDALLDLMS